MTRTHSLYLAGLMLMAATLAPRSADAFCGFYVSGAGGEMFNNATQVVMMREGTRTVLSMQNNYQGPPENFAMVVPVPVVLQKEHVKTLDAGIFDRVDRLAAPRLVEYWEEDPCRMQPEFEALAATTSAMPPMAAPKSARGGSLGVTVEAQFKVGEYEIVILSAKDATGLDTWLRREKYQIPEGAEPLLRPYVEKGSKFFVAKVDSAKVTFKDGMAMLSPLRFHYDSDEFSLPVRLGLINSAGTQDLIVHILAKGKRYEVSNYKNVTIPTNLDVKNGVRERFGEFYAALFDATLEKNPGSIVTEYSWDASSCDPCPTPALNRNELATLGEDVLYTPAAVAPAKKPAKKPVAGAPASALPPTPAPVMRRPPRRRWAGFVLTRLHARYGKGDKVDDLVFKETTAIAGGREFRSGRGAELEKGAQSASRNNFQGRYAIRHAWTGPITCENPVRGRWGGPPAGVTGSSNPKAATELAFAPRGQVQLASLVSRDIPELDVKAAGAQAPAAGTDTASSKPKPENKKPAPESQPEKKSKGCSAGGDGGGAPLVFLMLIAGALWTSRRSRLQADQG